MIRPLDLAKHIVSTTFPSLIFNGAHIALIKYTGLVSFVHSLDLLWADDADRDRSVSGVSGET